MQARKVRGSIWPNVPNHKRSFAGWREALIKPKLQMTCDALEKYACGMSKIIQIRKVPDALHRSLKARAATAGMSLSDYLLAEIKEIAERPTLPELRQRLHNSKPVSAQIDTALLVREEREVR